MYNRVVHILSTFESFKSHLFKLCHFMKKKLSKILLKNFCLGVAQAPQKSEILSNFGIFGILTLMYFLIIDV